MILGIGHDVCSIARIETLLQRFGLRLAKRCLTLSEMAHFSTLPQAQHAAYLAKRFAAKEAAAKALGTGIAQGVTLKDFDISRGLHTAPTLTLSGKAASIIKQPCKVHVSLSDEYPLASAFVIIEALDQSPASRQA